MDTRLAEVCRKLDRLTVMMENHQEQFKTQGDALKGWQDKVSKVLHGNGSPGLVMKVDRLEQSAERHKWALRAFGGGLLTAIAGALFALIKG